MCDWYFLGKRVDLAGMWDICCCSLCKVLSNSIVPHNPEGGAQTKISYFPTLKKNVLDEETEL